MHIIYIPLLTIIQLYLQHTYYFYKCDIKAVACILQAEIYSAGGGPIILQSPVVLLFIWFLFPNSLRVLGFAQHVLTIFTSPPPALSKHTPSPPTQFSVI